MTLRRVLIALLLIYTLIIVYLNVAIGLSRSPSPLLTPLNTVIGFSFALLHASDRFGWRRTLIFLGSAFVVSLALESLGVATGWVYGPYHYSENKLGPLFLGLVPLLIPLAWFMMIYASFILADWLTPTLTRVARPLVIAAVGGVIMTAWDLVVDPVMVQAGYWVWDVKGPYFGIPLQNYLGWWVTTALALIVFQITAKLGDRPARSSASDRLALIFYVLTALGEISGAWLMNLDGAALTGIFAMFTWVLLSWNKMAEGNR